MSFCDFNNTQLPEHSIAWHRIVECYAHIVPRRPDDNARKVFAEKKKLLIEGDVYGLITKQETNSRIATLYYSFLKFENAKKTDELVVRKIYFIDRRDPTEPYFLQGTDVPILTDLFWQYNKGTNQCFPMREFNDAPISASNQKTGGDIILLNSPITEKIVQTIGERTFNSLNLTRKCINNSQLKNLITARSSDFFGIVDRFLLADPHVYNLFSLKTDLQIKLRFIHKEASTDESNRGNLIKQFGTTWKLSAFVCDLEIPTKWNLVTFEVVKKNKYINVWKQQSYKVTEIYNFDKNATLGIFSFKDYLKQLLDVSAKRICYERYLTADNKIMSAYSLLMRRFRKINPYSKREMEKLKEEQYFLKKIIKNDSSRMTTGYQENIIRKADESLLFFPKVLMDLINEYYGLVGHFPIWPGLDESVYAPTTKYERLR